MSEAEQRAEGIVRLFLDERLENAGQPPGLRRAVVDALAGKGDELIRRSRDQIRQLRSPSSRWIPDAYFVDEAESESELQRAAAGLRAGVAREGMLTGDRRAFERELATLLSPSALWPMRQEASLVPRPATRVEALEWSRVPIPWVEDDDEWPPTGAEGSAGKRQLDGNEQVLARVAEEPYVGWVQLAMIERQRTFASRYPARPGQQLVLSTGLEVLDGPPPPRSLPLSGASEDGWCWPLETLMPGATTESARTAISAISGPLVALVIDGAEGNNTGVGHHPFSLIPVLAVVGCLGLRPEGQAPRFALVDDHGPACIGRLWRGFLIHDGNYSPLEPGVEGADVILREDLFEELVTIVGSQRLSVGMSVSLSDSDEPSSESE